MLGVPCHSLKKRKTIKFHEVKINVSLEAEVSNHSCTLKYSGSTMRLTC